MCLCDDQLKEISNFALKHEDILVGRNSNLYENFEDKNVDDFFMQPRGVNNDSSIDEYSQHDSITRSQATPKETLGTYDMEMDDNREASLNADDFLPDHDEDCNS